METIGQVKTYINELLPNGVSSTTIVTLINNELRKNWDYLTSTALYSFNTSSGVSVYSLPTDVTIGMVSGLQIANTTGSTYYQKYEFSGFDNDLTGFKYYDMFGEIGVYPIPDNTYSALLRHQEYPTLFNSTDVSVQFNVDQDWVDYIKFKVMARIAKAGNAPDVDLANGYESDAKELWRRIKMKSSKEKVKVNNNRWSYKDW
jgi:hypothetical protein